MSHPSNKVTLENVADVVHYHKPTDSRAKAHEDLAFAAERFIERILTLVPDCADRATAIRCVREAKMWASAAVALELQESQPKTFRAGFVWTCGPHAGEQIEYTSDGHINNCAVVNGARLVDCQMCGGQCPGPKVKP